MPSRDKTGPLGQGPLTGRGMGFCNSEGALVRPWCRGFRKGFGRGFITQPLELTPEEKKKVLESELKEIEDYKKEIEKKLKDSK